MADKIATREAYGNALAEFGEKYDFVVLDADLAAATKTGVFKKKFPERHFDCGIAEGNMMVVAAGLATTGVVPFLSSRSVTLSVTPTSTSRSALPTQVSRSAKTVLPTSAVRISPPCVPFPA